MCFTLPCFQPVSYTISNYFSRLQLRARTAGCEAWFCWSLSWRLIFFEESLSCRSKDPARLGADRSATTFLRQQRRSDLAPASWTQKD